MSGYFPYNSNTFSIIRTLSISTGHILQIIRTLFRSSRNFPDHLDIFQMNRIYFLDYPDIIRTLLRLSGYFPDNSDTFSIIRTLSLSSGHIFQIIRTLFRSSGNFPDHLDTFEISQTHLFLDYPDTFPFFRILSRSFRHFFDHPDTFHIIWTHFLDYSDTF